PAGCYCDDLCTGAGDCCADFAVCNTCSGVCGGQAATGCYCDAGCVGFGDCCPDACALCGAC
ncbi:MAG: hypothetical protein WKG00_27535, partial [Polyangiaceae bacterium]